MSSLLQGFLIAAGITSDIDVGVGNVFLSCYCPKPLFIAMATDTIGKTSTVQVVSGTIFSVMCVTTIMAPMMMIDDSHTILQLCLFLDSAT